MIAVDGDVKISGCCGHFVALHIPTGVKVSGTTAQEAKDKLKQLLSHGHGDGN